MPAHRIGRGLPDASRRRWGFGLCWIGAHTAAGAAIAAIGVSARLAVLAGLAAAYSLGTAVAGICSMSLRQEVTPDHLLGRVTAAFWTIQYALAPLGAGLLTAAAGRYDSVPVLTVAGVICVLVALCGLLTPLVRTAPGRFEARPVAG